LIVKRGYFGHFAKNCDKSIFKIFFLDIFKMSTFHESEKGFVTLFAKKKVASITEQKATFFVKSCQHKKK